MTLYRNYCNFTAKESIFQQCWFSCRNFHWEHIPTDPFLFQDSKTIPQRDNILQGRLYLHNLV